MSCTMVSSAGIYMKKGTQVMNLCIEIDQRSYPPCVYTNNNTKYYQSYKTLFILTHIISNTDEL